MNRRQEVVHPRVISLLTLAFFLVGCNPYVIKGRVIDAKGDTLPGVAVTVQGDDTQTLTNGLGEYAVPYRPGTLVLEFIKSGYTPGVLELSADTKRGIDATTVRLWPLPEAKGVYLFNDFRFESTIAVEPEYVRAEGAGDVFGTKRLADVVSMTTEPVLVGYKMPRQGMRLHRMRLLEVLISTEEMATPVSMWAPDTAVPVTPVALDTPQALLVQYRLDGPLEPGAYAIDWGALNGITGVEGRLFLFDVSEALAVPAEEGIGKGDAEGEVPPETG